MYSNSPAFVRYTQYSSTARFSDRTYVVAKEGEQLQNDVLKSDVAHRLAAHRNAIFQNPHQNQLALHRVCSLTYVDFLPLCATFLRKTQNR